jgi:Alpha-kinase family
MLKETPYKYYYGENFIEGRYQKYNSNAGWCDQSLSESSLIAQAFSHFSWQLTKGYMMIVDLQGATGVLTDPQIHCLDYTKYGKGNLGYHGIMKFFFTHICNPYCKKLGLIHPSVSNSIPEELKFYCMNMNKPEKLADIVYTICDLCREGFKICAGTLYAKRMNSQEKYCNKCNSKRLNSMKEGKCATCGSSFRSSEYWFNMKRTEFPTLCSKCRLERRNKMREDLAK